MKSLNIITLVTLILMWGFCFILIFIAIDNIKTETLPLWWSVSLLILCGFVLMFAPFEIKRKFKNLKTINN